MELNMRNGKNPRFAKVLQKSVEVWNQIADEGEFNADEIMNLGIQIATIGLVCFSKDYRVNIDRDEISKMIESNYKLFKENELFQINFK